MARTRIRGGYQIINDTVDSDDIKNNDVSRDDLNVTIPGRAVVRKVLAGTDIQIDYTGADEGTGDVTVSFNSSTGGITASSHRMLDQLVHEIAEDSYCEIERSGGRVSAVKYYTDNTKTTKIRDILYTRSFGRISQIQVIQYDNSGNTIVGETLVGSITRTGGRVSSIDWTRS